MPTTLGYPKSIGEVGGEKAADKVRHCRTMLQHGMEFRQTNRERAWERSEKQYKGDHWEGDAEFSDVDLITVNISGSTVNTIVPYVTGEEPRFLVEPFSGNATVRKARIQQSLLNRTWRSSKVSGQEHLEDVAVDFLIYGDGFMKVTNAIDEIRLADGDYAEIGEVGVERVDPWDVWLDPSADGLHNSRWVCQRIITTLAELKADDRLDLPEDFEPSLGGEIYMGDDGRLHERLFTVGDLGEDRSWCVIYEFYDLVDDVAIIFSPNSEMPLRWIESPECPIVQFGNYRLPRSPYHMGELEQLWMLQKELNLTRSQMATHRRRNAQKIAVQENALTDDAIAAIQSDEVNAIVPVKGDTDLDNLIKPLNVPNLTADIYNLSDIITRDVYEISGVNEYLRGATPEIRRTATEATIIEGASNVKSRYKLRLIETGTRKVGKLMLDTMAELYPQTDFDELQLFLTGSDAQAIASLEFGERMAGLIEDGAPEDELATFAEQNDPELYSDVSITPGAEIFDGTYEVFVEQHSTELRNPVMKEQRAREMFLALINAGPMLAQSGVRVNYRKLLERWFEASGITDIESLFDAGIDPMQQMMMQQQGGGGGAQPGQPPAESPLSTLQGMGAMGSENTGTMPPA